MIEATKITIIVIVKNKNKAGRSKLSNKRRSEKYCFDQKNASGEKHVSRMNFPEHLRKRNVSVNSKVYMVDF